MGLFKEAEAFRDALKSWRSHDFVGRLGQGTGVAGVRSEAEFVRRARMHGVDAPTNELTQVYREIQELRNWDPILCFELNNRPGDLWLEAHWFESQDGKSYVHY